MIITLSDSTEVEILAVNFPGGTVDWKRRVGYTGACITPVTITSFATAGQDIKAALEAEILREA